MTLSLFSDSPDRNVPVPVFCPTECWGGYVPGAGTLLSHAERELYYVTSHDHPAEHTVPAH